MARRRAGGWARRKARARRRELLRTHRRGLSVLCAVILALAFISVAVAGALGNANLAWFIAGAFYGALLVFWVVLFELLDPVSRHWIQGAEGEELTGRELGRIRRQGWRVVHNLHLQAGDIDHIAIGPGGIVAIETKCPNADWSWLAKSGTPQKWARQAKSSAFRTRSLVRQHCGLSVEVPPLVVVWARGIVESEPVRVDGVRFVHGTELADLLSGMRAMLSDDEVQRVHQSLERFARQLDEGLAFAGAARTPI